MKSHKGLSRFYMNKSMYLNEEVSTMRLVRTLSAVACGALAALALLASCAQKQKKETVFGKIGFHKIVQADLDKTLEYLTRISPMSRSQYEGDEGQQRLVEKHVDDEIMFRDGLKKGLGRSSRTVEEIETYRKFLVLRKYEQDEIDAKAGLPEKVFKKYYKAHKNEYKVNARALVKHILTASESDAQAILADLKKGLSFDSLAAEKSIDQQTSQSQGRLGWLTEGGSIPYYGKLPGFDAAVFKLKKGALSAPVQTEKGWHIIFIEDFKPATWSKLAEVRQQLRDQLLASDADIQKYYDEHQAEFTDPEKRKVAHIQLKDEPTARKVLAQALRPGADFAKLAKQFSQCVGTKENGGDLGEIQKGGYIAYLGKEPEFEAGAFALANINDLGMAKSGKGWHVVRLLGLQAARQKTLEEAKSAIRSKLLDQKKKDARVQLLARLEKKYKVKKAADPKDKNVFGKIGAQKITQADLDKTFAFLAKIEPTAQETYGAGDAGKQKLIDKHVEQQVIMRDGLKKGLDRDASITGELEKYKRYMVLRDYAQNELEAKAGLPEKEFKKYYREHKKDFKVEGRALVQHILTASEDDAQAVLAELKRGVSFDSLTARKSIDSLTRATRGSLGWITETGSIPYLGAMPEINQAVFALKEGGVSKPVKTAKGWHIIKAEQLKPGSFRPLSEVYGQIRDELLAKPAELEAYYQAHQAEYQDPEQRSVSDITVKDEAQAKKLAAQARTNADFAALAKKYSTNKAAAEQGGALGYIQRDAYIRFIGREPDYETAAFKLAAAGEVSDPVKIQNDWHVIKLTEIRAARQKPFDEVKAMIKNQLLSQKRGEGSKQAMANLRKKYRVKIFEIQRTEKELFDLAQKALEDKNYQKAIDSYARIVTDYPKSDKVYQAVFLQGWVYSEYLKDYDNADKFFNEVLAKWPKCDLADDAEWMTKNQRNPNALDFIIKNAEKQDSLAKADSLQAKKL
jgi:peptidyl-prolyl cis-trans isomerase C